jgi:hypothetical protein
LGTLGPTTAIAMTIHPTAAPDNLGHIPLISFLEAYPEPAFILCLNAIPHSSLELMYVNPALHELLVGADSTHVLDTQTFLSTLASDDDVLWLSAPITAGKVAGDSKSVNFCPTWLPRDHSPVDLELTPTPINLPTVIPRVATTNRSFVFTASPRHAPMNFLRSETQRGPSTGKRRQKSRSSSSSWPSRLPPVIANSAELPSRLIETFDWEKSPLGPRDKWPLSLQLMVKYLMGKPISVSGIVTSVVCEP